MLIDAEAPFGEPSVNVYLIFGPLKLVQLSKKVSLDIDKITLNFEC